MKVAKEEKMKESNVRVSLESEASALKAEITTLQQTCGAGAGNGDVKVLQACLSDKETEINRLKELANQEKMRADSEQKIAENEKEVKEAHKLMEKEKNISVEKGMQLAKIEEGYRLQQVHLGKQVNEMKMKLASEVSKIKGATKRFEAEKQVLLVEKRNAEAAEAERRLVVLKKTAEEKSGADAELFKVEEQKKLAELRCRLKENFNARPSMSNLSDRSVIERDKMRKRILDTVECIENLSSEDKKLNMQVEYKLSDLLGKMDKSIEQGSETVNNHENHLQAKNDRAHKKRRTTDTFVYEKKGTDEIKSGVWGCKWLQTHSRLPLQNMPNTLKMNVTTQFGNPDVSQMHREVENEFVKPSSTTIGACDPLRRNMQSTPFLAPSGRNCADSITGINSNLEPLISGSNRTTIQSSAVNSSTMSFSDAQLTGSQERGALQVTISTKLTEENCYERPSMSNPSDISVIESDKMRKRILDTLECIENLSSESKKLNMQIEDKLSDLHGKMDKSIEQGREIVNNHEGHLQAKGDRAQKKRRTTDTFVYETKGTDKKKSGVCEVAVGDGNVVKLLDLQNASDEECYRRAKNAPLSPSLPEIEQFDMHKLKPFLEEVRHEDLMSQRGLFPSSGCDVIDIEIDSNNKKIDAFRVPFNTHHKPAQARKTDVKLPGSLHNQLPNLCFFLSDPEDNGSICRTFWAARSCIPRCSLDTQTEWAVASILNAVEMEEMPLQREKHSVLLSLLLFNFNMITAMKFGKIWSGDLILCLNSYAEHIHRVMTDADTRILFLEKFSLQELLCLIEDFLIEGKVMSKSESRTNSFLDGVDTLSSEVASNEQLVAASIILASLCAATDHVEFICEASYKILRLCRWDSMMVLTILHIFANLGGRKYFELDNFGLLMIVLKSLVTFMEGESVSVTTASGLPSMNQLHTELCTSDKCPFSEGAESIDIVTLSLLLKIHNCLLQQAEQFDSSNFRFLSDNHNAGHWSNLEVVQCASSSNCDAPCCLKKHVICPTQPDVLLNVTTCQLTDILSLLELVASKMSWQWANVKLVPQLLNMLDSCVVENFAVASIISLLGQLGR
ncbi:hypothetical protein E2542_SST01147 [Spatholobus suberectus]|nr:hypothetical protein E2542_SST01147 [Spatholobus suberectus]